ncbi:MAG TPA: DUF4386 domain-containing protein [Pyrinomonadaceae bacterium]|nr:DUF4386 domain-containing protein [Pyrinomonadaceae bacterium]
MRKSEMTARFREESPVRQARIAGACWLLCILAGLGGFIAASPLIVANDAAATAANILAKESLYRLGFAFDLISGTSYLVTTVFLYYVLKPVSRSLSMLAAFFGLAGVAIGGISWVLRLASLVLLHGDQYLSAFTTSQLQATSMIALKLQLTVFSIGMVFFGIQCISIGCLVARSIFLPRVLGIVLAIGGTSYVIASFASFLIPSFGPHLIQFVLPVALIGEGSLTLWLLVKGVNTQRWKDQASAAERIIRT